MFQYNIVLLTDFVERSAGLPNLPRASLDRAAGRGRRKTAPVTHGDLDIRPVLATVPLSFILGVLTSIDLDPYAPGSGGSSGSGSPAGGRPRCHDATVRDLRTMSFWRSTCRRRC